MSEQHTVLFDGTDHCPMGRYLSAVPEPTRVPQVGDRPPKVYTPKPAPEVYTGIVGQIRDALLADRLTARELASRFNWPPDTTADRLYRLQAKGLVKWLSGASARRSSTGITRRRYGRSCERKRPKLESLVPVVWASVRP